MIQPLLSFFSRTKEQKEFEQQLYMEGLVKEQELMIEKINEIIVSKEFALKFTLQELDVLGKEDSFSQKFAEESGFHVSEYSGALEKFEEEKEELEEVQSLLLSLLNKISDDKIMLQTSRTIINGVMEHWAIGKFAEGNELLVEEENIGKEVVVEKKKISYLKELQAGVMQKLIYADDKIQDVLDAYSLAKEKRKMKRESFKVEQPKGTIKKVELEPRVKIYTEDRVNALMEEYSNIIEEIITGNINPVHSQKIESFQEQIALAAVEENNLASVFCAFFEAKTYASNLPLPITHMDDKSKIFFIEILNTFEKKGFSKHLYKYLNENKENVYALGKENDMFMQYLIAFWYVLESETNILENKDFWYTQSAVNGFQPAIEKIK